MADSAKNAFPVIESNIDQLTNGFSDKVNESMNTITNYMKTHNDEAVKS